MKTQQIIACDTTDDDCNGCDLITVFNCVMDAGSIDNIDCINSDADYPESAMEEMVVVATTTDITTATTTEVNKL